MITLNGTPLKSLPLVGLRRVRDLIYFDGPLLSHFEHANGDDYLYYWVDCDELCNRWMIMRVAEASILRLIYRSVPLNFVIPNLVRDSFVYFVDIGHKGEHSAVHLVNKSDIPAEYLPDAGSYLTHKGQSQDDDTYAFMCEGEWTSDSIGDFPKLFSKTYSLVYSLNVLRVPRYDKLPWRGGFSHMHFFNWVAGKVPVEHRLGIKTIQIASPGFIRFKLHTPTARQVIQCIYNYRRNELMNLEYSKLYAYIRMNDLNRELSPDDDAWKSVNTTLQAHAIELMKGFTPINESAFIDACARPFEAAKIAMAFYRYIKELSEFEAKGLVRFSPEYDF